MKGKKSWHKHTEILSCDLAGYSKLPSHEKRAVKARLNDLVDACIPEGASKLGWADAGDGGFLFLDGAPGCALKAVRLNFQAQDGDGDRLSLRFALHHGRIHGSETDSGWQYSGSDLDHTARILDGMPRDPAEMIVGSDGYVDMLRDQVALDGVDLMPLQTIEIKGQPFGFHAIRLDEKYGATPWFFQEREDRFPEDRDELSDWFRTQTRETCINLTSRSVLRVLPLANWSRVNATSRSEILIPTLQGIAASLCFSYSTNYSARLSMSIDDAFHFRKLSGDQESPSARLFHGVQDENYYNILSDSVFGSINYVKDEGEDSSVAIKSFLFDCRYAGMNESIVDWPMPMQSIPLWPTENGLDYSGHWRKLEKLLVSDDAGWEAWTRWYEGRLKGMRSSERLEVARVLAVREEDYEQGAAHVNARIAEAEERAERERTPLPGALDVDPPSGKVRYFEAPAEEAAPDDPYSDEIFTEIRAQLDPSFDLILSEEDNAMLGDLRRPVEIFRKLTARDEATSWLVQIEALQRTIIRLTANDKALAEDGAVVGLKALLSIADTFLRQRYPKHSAAVQSRQEQTQRKPTEAEREALDEVVAAFADILEARIRADIEDALDPMDETGEAVRDEVPAEMEGLSIQQKQRLYHLKALFLHLKEIVGRSASYFEDVFGKAADAAKKIESYRKAYQTLSNVWDVLWRFFTGGDG